MKLKMAADRVLKRFWRENRKEDALRTNPKLAQSNRIYNEEAKSNAVDKI